MPKAKMVDISKLISVTTYAKRKKLTRPAVYYQIEHGLVPHEKIDGVPFVYKK